MKSFSFSRGFKLIRRPAYLVVLFCVFGLYYFGATFNELWFEQRINSLSESLTGHLVSIHKNQLKVLDWCHNLSYDTLTRYSVLSEDGKIICDSRILPTNPPEYVNLNELKALKERGLTYYILEDKLLNSSKISLVHKVIEDDKILYLHLGQDFKLASSYAAAKAKVLTFFAVFLLFIFIYCAYIIINREFQIHRKIRRLITRLNSKGIYPISPLSSYDSSVDELRLVDRQINKSINKLKKMAASLEFERGKLQTLLDSLQLGIVSTDAKQEILFYNSAFERICDPKKPAAGKLWEYFRHPDLLTKIDQTLITQQAQKVENFTFSSVNNEKASYQVNLYPLKSPLNERPGLMAIFTDETQQQLMRKMRIDFVANISHEVRTPLTGLKGYMDLIKEELPDNKFIGKMNDNINRLLSLFEDLLNLSIIESDRSLNLEVFAPELLTRENFAIVQAKFSNLKMNLEIKDEAKEVTLDKELLDQVLTNLIENIFKYAPESEKIEVHWRKTETNVFLDVKDFGPGIKPEHQYRVFERFYRTSKSRSQKIPGTGLGLSIVKNIIEKHKGSIYLETNVGEGTHFKIGFPNFDD